jgi:hypothetical protein
MTYIKTLWKLTVEDSLHGVSDWLKHVLKATHYHPEKAYMRAHQEDRGRDRPVSSGGETSIRGSF